MKQVHHTIRTVLPALAALLAAAATQAEIKFKHHYISTRFPKMTGTGQLVAADFTKDGKMDLLMGQHFGTPEKRQYLFVNDGTPDDWPFTVVTTNNTGDGGVNALDVDGDGWTDVISSGSWFRNSKDPAVPYARHIYAQDSYGGHDMMIADIDGDGKKDVVVNTDKGQQNGGQNGLFWFKIPADPTQAWTKTRIGDAVHSGMWPGGIGDIDGDGDLDVFNRAWYQNVDGKGATWTKRDNVGFGRQGQFGYSQQAVLVDMDKDGDLDLVQCESDYFNNARAQWNENVDGKGGAWTAHPLPMNGETMGDFHSLGVRDFDGDGDIDIFSGESEWNAIRARSFLWENLDGKGGSFARRTILEGLGVHNAIAADMDGDGDFDIVNKEFEPKPWNLLSGGQHADFLENQSSKPVGIGDAAAAPGRGPVRLRSLGMHGNRLAVESRLTGPHRVDLRDAAGRLVASRKLAGPGRAEFTGGGLAPGLYHLMAINGSEVTRIQAVLHP